MIVKFYMFSNGFIQQSNEIDDLLKKILQNILVNTVNGIYHDKIESCSIGVAIQLMLNAQWFEYACEDIEALLLDKRFPLILIQDVLPRLALGCFHTLLKYSKKRESKLRREYLK